MISSKRIFGACVLSAGLLLAPQAAPAAIYWQSGDDWVAGNAPEGSTFTESNTPGGATVLGLDRNKTDEPLANSGFFTTSSVTGNLNSAAIARQAPGGGTVNESGDWLADFGDTYTINRIVVRKAASENHGFFGFTASYSLDGETWTNAGTVATVTVAQGGNAALSREVAFNDVEARYLRLTYGSTSAFNHYRMDRMDLYLVPEPASLMLLGAGVCVAFARRRSCGIRS